MSEKGVGKPMHATKMGLALVEAALYWVVSYPGLPPYIASSLGLRFLRDVNKKICVEAYVIVTWRRE